METTPLVVSSSSSRNSKSSNNKNMTKKIMFQRKQPFHVPSDDIEFDNRPNCVEAVVIKIFHWLSRILVQWGALHTWNPLVWIPSYILYQVDLIWSGLDKQYYVKRRAMYGPNFISVVSLVVSKFDSDANALDALDTLFLTMPQRRGFFLGSTIMCRPHLPKDVNREGKPTRNVSLLHVSDDRSVEEKKEGELDHDDIRESVMRNFLGPTQLSAISERAKDKTTQGLLTDFAKQTKDMDSSKLSPIVERFLIQYYHYVLFNLPVKEIPVDLLQETFYKGLRYVLYLYGPRWMPNFLLRPIVRPRGLNKKLLEIREYYATSPVFEDFQEYPPGQDFLTKEGLLQVLEMLIGIAALQGTKALALACLTQMPSLQDADSESLRKAVLEVARLDAPVTGAHCIVNNEEGLETTIGSKTLKFPKGTTVFTAMTLANTDEKRFQCPYVFDPNRLGMPDNLTSFNSIGERTGPSPRICPGRHVAVECVCQMLKAKMELKEEQDDDEQE